MSRKLLSRNQIRPVAEWVSWHAGELVGVLVPAGFAVAVSGWFALISGVIAAGWAVHEVRLARRERQIRSTRAQRAITTGQTRTDDEQASDTRQDEDGRDYREGVAR